MNIDQKLQSTVFHRAHIDAGAKMAGFAGYDMPLFYDTGALAEHIHVRSHAGLFDVSHMGQVMVSGADVVRFLQTITPSFYETAPHGRAKYTVFTNDQGGIIDDLIVTRMDDDTFFLVVNAGRKDIDLAHMHNISKELGDVQIDHIQNRALLALQGPDSTDVLKEMLGIDTSHHPYMVLRKYDDLYISRLGYTGEDGFEISMPANRAMEIWDKLTSHDSVNPTGLACRDTLRLEMGYPLYGHDLTEQTSPVAANIGWVVSKNNTGYIGRDVIAPQKEDGTQTIRTGVKLLDKGIAREGAEILVGDTVIGHLTSGGFSPMLDCGIGQGYVDISHYKVGNTVQLRVRNRLINAEMTALSLVDPKTKSAKLKTIKSGSK